MTMSLFKVPSVLSYLLIIKNNLKIKKYLALRYYVIKIEYKCKKKEKPNQNKEDKKKNPVFKQQSTI